MGVSIQYTPLAHSYCSLLVKRYTCTIFCAMSAHIPAGLLCIQPSTLYLSKSKSAQEHSPTCKNGCMSTLIYRYSSWRWHAACHLDEPGFLSLRIKVPASAKRGVSETPDSADVFGFPTIRGDSRSRPVFCTFSYGFGCLWAVMGCASYDEPMHMCELSLSKQAAEAFFILVALILALCLCDDVWVFYGRVQTLARARLWLGRR